ncbi:hypothetical protein GTV32_15140 [Gordonia sp. SID5947]|uniref:hypothetical protein n=1 Tax=Gordonia sp. SID5947 TaxID=2690315 RepID=UPI00136EEDCE|nr:hypothetical protein [Gordonia sp. SID5947]MYR07555.1 hypothetical protein [Gordonia sp. SID5947]
MTSNRTRAPEATHRDAWLAAAHSTDALSGLLVLLGVLLTAAIGWGIHAAGHPYPAYAVFAVVTVFFIGWCAWDGLSRLLSSFRIPARRFRMMGYNVVATADGLIVDTLSTSGFATWAELAQTADLSVDRGAMKPHDKYPKIAIVVDGAVIRGRRRSRRVATWASRVDAHPERIRIPLTPTFDPGGALGAVLAVIGDHCPELGTKIDRAMATVTTLPERPVSTDPAATTGMRPSTTLPTAPSGSSAPKAPVQDIPLVSADRPPRVGPALLLLVFIGLPALYVVGDLAIGTGDTRITSAAVTAWAVVVVWFRGRNRLVRTLSRIGRVNLDRLHRMNSRLTATPGGLIIDHRRMTEFLPWAGIRTAPHSIASPGSPTPVSEMPPSTLIVGDGVAIPRSRRWRAIGDWAEARSGSPTTVYYDVSSLAGSESYGRLLATLRQNCAGVEVTAPTTTKDGRRARRRQRDEWLADSQLSSMGTILTVLLVITAAIAVLGGLVVALATQPIQHAVALAVFALLGVIALKPVITSMIRAGGRQPDRFRWAGCHLAVTPDGLILTGRRRTEWLSWAGITGVEPHPMNRRQARILGVPPIVRPTIVGSGLLRSHWFPIRHIGSFRSRQGRRGPVHIDPEVFFDQNEIARHLWRYRPDVAAECGFPEAVNVPVTSYGSGDSTHRSLRGSLTTSDASTAVTLRIPDYGATLTEYFPDQTRIRVSGERIPTVSIERHGGRRRHAIPIGTTKLSSLAITVDGTSVEPARVQRDFVTFRRHQYAITDGTGGLFLMKPTYFVSGNEMQAHRGIRPYALRPIARRHGDGRITLTLLGSTTDDQDATHIALTLALAAAFGTRSVQLRNIPLLPAHLLNWL